MNARKLMGSTPAARPTDIEELKPPPSDAVMLGGRYVLVELLGEGGMGAVYRVRDLELDEEVALKLLQSSYAETEGALERFRREVKLARRVTHPNVARVFDFGTAQNRRFLTMELVEGESLKVRAARGKVPLPEVLRIVADIARGLAAAHAAGVVHRDLKPDNVLLDTGSLAERGVERVVVTDFGIAVLAERRGMARTGSIVGTPEYMAPEQLEARDLDGRADVYALGVLMFELLVARFPFEGKTPYAVAAARLVEDAPKIRTIDPSIPEPVAALVDQMLRRSRESRPEMLRVVDVLDGLRGASRLAHAPTITPMSAPIVDRPPLTVVIAPFVASDPALHESARALADSVGDALSSLHGFRLIPASSLRHGAATAEVDALALGREHDAWLVLEGSLRASAGRTRLRARIVEVSTGLQLWGDKIDAESTASFDLEDEVTGVLVRAMRDVARSIDVRSLRGGHGAPAEGQARDLYERGCEAAKEYGDHLERGIALLREANRAAPDNAHVMSALGAALVRSWSFNGTPNLLLEAEDWSLRALATGTRIGQTFNTIGVLRLHQGDLRAAIAAFREAMARSPRLAEPHSYLGRLLSESGHLDEAQKRLQRAVELDPGDHHALTELARLAAMTNEWDRADALLETAAVGRAEGIVRATKARFTVWRRDPEKLAAAVEDVEARRDEPGLRVVVKLVLPLWKAIASGEELEVSDPRLGALRDAAGGASMRLTMFWFQLLAEVHAVLGHDEAALHAIENAAMRTLIDVTWIDRCPAIAHLRADARHSRARAAVAARAAALWL